MRDSSSKVKTILLGVVSIVVILASAFWIYRTQFAPNRDLNENLHEGIGEAMANATVQLLGNDGEIVLVTMEEGTSTELDVQVNAFKRIIYQSGVKIARTDTIGSEKSSEYSSGRGMSGRRYLKLVNKYPNVGALVSFVGSPDGEDDELGEIENTPPKFVAFVRSPKDLPELFKRKLIHVAILPRFQFPAPGPENPKTRKEWFEKYFQVVLNEKAASGD